MLYIMWCGYIVFDDNVETKIIALYIHIIYYTRVDGINRDYIRVLVYYILLIISASREQRLTRSDWVSHIISVNRMRYYISKAVWFEQYETFRKKRLLCDLLCVPALKYCSFILLLHLYFLNTSRRVTRKKYNTHTTHIIFFVW
jgi:hypothetical protein